MRIILVAFHQFMKEERWFHSNGTKVSNWNFELILQFSLLSNLGYLRPYLKVSKAIPTAVAEPWGYIYNWHTFRPRKVLQSEMNLSQWPNFLGLRCDPNFP